jgi:hypothetical protein
MTTAHCRFCSRTDVTIDPRNGRLRWHKIPRGVDVGVPMTYPGDRCPGSNSDSFWPLDDPDRPQPVSAARARLDRFLRDARPGTTVEVTEETHNGFTVAQAAIRGGIDTICITVGCRDGKRSRVSARYWFNSGGRGRDIPVSHLGYRVRHQFVDARP